MKLSFLHALQTAAVVARPRPTSTRVAALVSANGTGSGTAVVAPWSIAARKAMTVPAFHDPWPLCSST